MLQRTALVWCAALLGLLGTAVWSAADEEIDRLYPLGDDLRVMAADVESPAYHRLVDEMLITDLRAEWQRVETADNPESFLEQHGGREQVLADPILRRAYERRVAIREQFLELMRRGFARYKSPAPFDEGQMAAKAGTVQGAAVGEAPELAIVLPAPGAENHWPRFRGPDGQGNTGERNLPLTWSPEENIVWRTELPGQGNSSPIIWGDRIFLTTAETDGSRRALVCLDRTDGRIVWKREAPEHELEPNVRDKNGFASATPVTDGQRVIASFGSGGLLCVDFDGTTLWHHPTPGFNTTWGTGASPLLYDDLVIFIHDQNKADPICLALNKETGEQVWQQSRERAMGWSTPIAVRVGDHDELLYPGGYTVKAYDPRTGRELWSLTGPTQEVIPTLLVDKHMVYSASGRLGPIIALRPGGQGDVTETHLAWSNTRGGPLVPTPLLCEGRIYSINDTGIVTCLDASSGEMLWRDRLRDQFSASPIEAAGLLYCCGESGKTYVLRTGDELDIAAENDLAEPILASPAALAGLLYIRTDAALYCIGSK